MRFLAKAFVIVAAATAFFSSPAEAFTTESIRSHASTLHSHIQSNHDALLSGIRSIQFHAQGATDCSNANYAPTEANVKACFDIKGAPAYTDNCAANLNGPQCKVDISKALLLWAAQGQFPSPGGDNVDMKKCTAAIDKFSLDINTKCDAVIKTLSATPSATATPGEILNTQCSAMSGTAFVDCKAVISTIAEVQTACPTFGLGQIKAKVKTVFQILDGPLSAVCTPDDADSSKYCLSSVLSTTSTDKFDLSTLTDSTLNQMCKPCLQTVVNKIAALGGNLGSFDQQKLKDGLSSFQALCVKDPTNPSKFCMNTFLSLTKTEKGKSPDLNAVCSPCLEALIMNTKPFLTANQLWSLEFTSSYLCDKDNNGAYCATQLSEAVLTPVVLACSSTTATCSDACKTAVDTVFKTQSCCFEKLGMRNIGRILEFIGPTTDPKIQAAMAALYNANTCTFTPSPAGSCEAPTADIPITISLANIDAKRLGDNATLRTLFEAALSTDLSLAFAINTNVAINTNAIVIGKFEADPNTKGGVKVSFTIKVDAAFRGGYASAFNAKLQQQGGLALTNTAKTAEQNQAEIDDTQPLTASGPGAATSAAVHTSGSIVAVVAMAIVAAFAARC